MGRRHAAASGLAITWVGWPAGILGAMPRPSLKLAFQDGRRHHTGVKPGGHAMPSRKRKTMPRRAAGGRATHDVGGLEFGPIDRHEHDLALWEKRTDAMLILLVGPKKGAFAIDAHRRVIEDYGQQTYDRITYYEKWIRAIRNLIVEQGIVSREEIDQRMAEVRERFANAGRKASKERGSW